MSKGELTSSQVTFTNGQTLGEPIEGYITLCFDDPIFVTSIAVELSSVIYTGVNTLGGIASVLPDEDTNEKSWSSVSRKVKMSKEFQVVSPHYVMDERITEIPPGTHKFAFRISAGEFTHGVSVFENSVGICYEITPIIYALKNKKITGKHCVVPLIYTNTNLPTELCDPVYTKKEYNKYVLDISCDVGSAFQGASLTGKFSVTNRSKTSIERVSVFFATFASDSLNKTQSKRINSSSSIYNIPVGTSTFTYKMNVPMTTPPDMTDAPMRMTNMLVIEFSKGTVKKQNKRIVLPVYIVARPANSRNAEEFMKAMNLDAMKITPFNEVPFGLPPKYSALCPQGVEEAVLQNGDPIAINHMARDNNFLDFKSTTLPSHLSVGYLKNEPLFLDHTSQMCSFVDPRKKGERLPQHVMSECNGYLTLLVEDMIGIPKKTIFTVRDLVKKHHLEGRIEVPLDNAQNNVIITGKFNGKNVGFVEIDLNLLPFQRGISAWYFLTESEECENGFFGMVRLNISYNSSPHGGGKTFDYPAYISHIHFPYYQNTKKSRECYETRARSYFKSGCEEFVTFDKNGLSIKFPEYIKLSKEITAALPVPIPVLRGNASYVASNPNIDIDVARKRRPSAMMKTPDVTLVRGNSVSGGAKVEVQINTIQPIVKERPAEKDGVATTRQIPVVMVQERSKSPKMPHFQQKNSPTPGKRRLSLNSIRGKKNEGYGTLDE